jgi:cysteinyl-tRNA synthetase
LFAAERRSRNARTFAKKTDDWFRKNGDLISEEEIEQLISERKAAKLEKNFRLADEIRKKLEEKNIRIEDTPNGTTWRSIT